MAKNGMPGGCVAIAGFRNPSYCWSPLEGFSFSVSQVCFCDHGEIQATGAYRPAGYRDHLDIQSTWMSYAAWAASAANLGVRWGCCGDVVGMMWEWRGDGAEIVWGCCGDAMRMLWGLGISRPATPRAYGSRSIVGSPAPTNVWIHLGYIRVTFFAGGKSSCCL